VKVDFERYCLESSTSSSSASSQENLENQNFERSLMDLHRSLAFSSGVSICSRHVSCAYIYYILARYIIDISTRYMTGTN
jgi:hypothetical protein